MPTRNDNINELISQALAKNPSVTTEDVINCVRSCIAVFSSEEIIYSSTQDFTFVVLSSIAEYLQNYQIEFTINDLMDNLNTLVSSISKGEIKLKKTSPEYKTIRKGVLSAFSVFKIQSSEETPILSTDETPTPSSDESSTQKSKRVKSGRAKAEKKSTLVKSSDEDLIPDDLEWIDGTSDLYISPSEGQAYIKRGGIKVYYRKVFSTLPTKVIKLHVPGAYKGQATQYRVTINGQTEVFTHDDLRFGKWYELFKSNIGVANTPSNGQYAQIISHMANKSEMEHLFLQTGIHEVDGIYGYLLPNGDFITNKEYKTPVNFAHKLKGDVLEIWDNWNEQANEWNEEIAIDAIKYCLGLSPLKGQAIVLASHQIRTLSKSIKSGNFRTGHLLYLRGKAGSGKTSLTCFTANVAKPSLYDGSLETNYKGTKASIEKTIDEYGDIPFIIDDFEPGDSQAEKKAGEALLTAMAKSAYDGTSIRPRQNGDMSDKKSNYVYTFPTTTSILYPSDLSEGALRRTFFVEVTKGDIHTSEGDFNLTEAHDLHIAGLAKVGRRVLFMHITNLNEKGIKIYADERKQYFSEYKANIQKMVKNLWHEKYTSDIPGIVDNLLSIAANITLGAKDIDDVTNRACNLVEYIQVPLARMVFDQLLLIEGMRSIEGESLLDEAIKELFANISGSIPVSNKIYRLLDYRSKLATDELKVPIKYGDKEYIIPIEQWEGMQDTNGRDKLVLGYVDINKEDFNKSILYLTKAGKEALLQVASTTEGLEHVKTSTKLSQLLDKEGWIIKRNNNNLSVPFNPKSTKAQEKGLALSFERLLHLIFDIKSYVESLEDSQEQAQSNGKGTPENRGNNASIENKQSGKSKSFTVPSVEEVESALNLNIYPNRKSNVATSDKKEVSEVNHKKGKK